MCQDEGYLGDLPHIEKKEGWGWEIILEGSDLSGSSDQ